MIPSILHSGKGKTMEIVKKINDYQGLWREGGRNRKDIDDFQGNETILCDTTMGDTHNVCQNPHVHHQK